MTVTHDDIARHLAEKGAALLDRVVPDWMSRITQPLDINSPHTCVIAQTLGDGLYIDGISELRHLLDDPDLIARDNGFMPGWFASDSPALAGIDMTEFDADELDAYGEFWMTSPTLTAAWKKLMSERANIDV